MPAYVRVYGYKLSRAATIQDVSPDLMRRELLVRGVTCEIPGCRAPATAVMLTGVAAVLCSDHDSKFRFSPKIARALESAVLTYVQGHMAISAQQAYENPDSEIVMSFDAEIGILDQARFILAGAEVLTSSATRLHKAPSSMSISSQDEKSDTSSPKPTLVSLPKYNAELLPFGLFSD